MRVTSSGYIAARNEANFGPVIRQEVVHGMHIAPEIITWDTSRFYAVHWFKGLPGHDKLDAIRFPHGLMLWGEGIMDCAARLARKQLGMSVKSVRVLTVESYVDKEGHWHIEPEILAEVSGRPRKPVRDSRIVTFGIKDIPEMAFWKASEFRQYLEEHL